MKKINRLSLTYETEKNLYHDRPTRKEILDQRQAMGYKSAHGVLQSLRHKASNVLGDRTGQDKLREYVEFVGNTGFKATGVVEDLPKDVSRFTATLGGKVASLDLKTTTDNKIVGVRVPYPGEAEAPAKADKKGKGVDHGKAIPVNPHRIPKGHGLVKKPGQQVSRDDIRAIHNYSIRSPINSQLRKQDARAEDGTPIKEATELSAALTALQKTDKYEGFVHRALPPRVATKIVKENPRNDGFNLTEGSTLHEPAFTSTSTNLSATLHYVRENRMNFPDRRPLLMTTYTHSGVPISQFAKYPELAEITFQPGMKTHILLSGDDPRSGFRRSLAEESGLPASHGVSTMPIAEKLPGMDKIEDDPDIIKETGAHTLQQVKTVDMLDLARPSSSPTGQVTKVVGQLSQMIRALPWAPQPEGGGPKGAEQKLRSQLATALNHQAPVAVAAVLQKGEIWFGGKAPVELRAMVGTRQQAESPMKLIHEAVLRHYKVGFFDTNRLLLATDRLLSKPAAERLFPQEFRHASRSAQSYDDEYPTMNRPNPVQVSTIVTASVNRVSDPVLRKQLGAYMKEELLHLKVPVISDRMEEDRFIEVPELTRLAPTMQHFVTHMAPKDRAVLQPALDCLRSSVRALAHPSAEAGSALGVDDVMAIVQGLKLKPRPGLDAQALRLSIAAALHAPEAPSMTDRFMMVLKPEIEADNINLPLLTLRLGSLTAGPILELVDRQLSTLPPTERQALVQQLSEAAKRMSEVDPYRGRMNEIIEKHTVTEFDLAIEHQMMTKVMNAISEDDSE
ncbi:hypothetical protein HLB44_34740 [Aquincola sp. S2]|uniref:Uncharacterized protein n=1 Tax=Pseudaquabacterium terrae TaxID=2732868 RepID=A0ABX2ETW9_9BURK|nr:hypothetical protein [Aquabacterium terrae]NRF72155.1 hypothetical protein [Aquabacterium terrae]